jgi:hypothetical protein
MRQLTKLELSWAAAALGAIFPGSREAGLADISAMDVAGFLREVCRCVPLRVVLGLRLAIWIVTLAPLFVLARFATIRALGADDRERVVAAMLASHSYAVRSLVMILKAMGALLYAGDERVRARMLAAPERRPPPSGRLVTLRVRGSHAA